MAVIDGLLGRKSLSDFFGATPETLLVDDPLAAYLSFAPRLSRSPNQRRGFRTLFPSIFDEFQGQRAETIRGGMLPTQSFTGFVDNFDILERYLAQSPRARGESPARLAPRVRFSRG
jgi:hypothetical protein